MAFGIPKNLNKWQFAKDLYSEIDDDNVFNGGAALAYFFFLAVFPAMIFLLSIIPYLPIENLHQAVMDFIRQILPSQAAKSFEGTIAEITLTKRSGLLSFGAIATLWAASSGIYAIMQQLNVSYDVRESRPFWKARLTSILLTILFGALILTSFTLIVAGGIAQDWVQANWNLGEPTLIFFGTLRWAIIAVLLLASFACLFYWGPDVEQEFKFITPGAIAGVVVLALASIGFRIYVENFGDYAATYGSIGAVIILMLWLYITGTVILIGSEVNALIEHYSPDGKLKGEKTPAKNSRGYKSTRWKARHEAIAANAAGAPAPLPDTRPRPAPGTNIPRGSAAPVGGTHARTQAKGRGLEIVLALGAIVLSSFTGSQHRIK